MPTLTITTAPKMAATILPFRTGDLRSLELSHGRYVVRPAITSDEIDAALRLRFAIFNVELGEGLAKSFANGKDEDVFDRQCEQVIVIDRTLKQIVGTCRLRTYDQAKSHSGFYSSARFNLSTLPNRLLENAVEFGRTCIARGHRNKNSFRLLWRFLMGYSIQTQKQYLFGCCSLKSQDPLAGGSLYEWLREAGYTHDEFRVIPRPGSKCIFYKTAQKSSKVNLPSPLYTYLKRGAKICGLPALDRDFRTIDFFTLLDLQQSPVERPQGDMMGGSLRSTVRSAPNLLAERSTPTSHPSQKVHSTW